MAVDINIKTEDTDHITVNGKSVRKDMDDNWSAQSELLTIAEAKYFNEFLRTLKKSKTNDLTVTYTFS